jgi:hypothetical protein
MPVKSTACTSATRIGSPASLFWLGHARPLLGQAQAAYNLVLQLRERKSQYALSRVEHDIQRPFTRQERQPHRFSHAALDAIALDGAPQHLADGKPDARPTRSCLSGLSPPEEYRHVARKLPAPSLIYALEVRMFQQAPGLPAPLCHIMANWGARIWKLAAGSRHSALRAVCTYTTAPSKPATHVQFCGISAIVQTGLIYSRNPGFTETRLRPLARRRDNTARPLLVFMRERKPCVFERRRRLGWNVRFGIENGAPHWRKIGMSKPKV